MRRVAGYVLVRSAGGELRQDGSVRRAPFLFLFFLRVLELFGLVETPGRVGRRRQMPALGARFGPHLEGALQAARLLESPVSSLLHKLLPGNQDIAPTFSVSAPS
jgi:hypothetical protein